MINNQLDDSGRTEEESSWALHERAAARATHAYCGSNFFRTMAWQPMEHCGHGVLTAAVLLQKKVQIL